MELVRCSTALPWLRPKKNGFGFPGSSTEIGCMFCECSALSASHTGRSITNLSWLKSQVPYAVIYDQGRSCRNGTWVPDMGKNLSQSEVRSPTLIWPFREFDYKRTSSPNKSECRVAGVGSWLSDSREMPTSRPRSAHSGSSISGGIFAGGVVWA